MKNFTSRFRGNAQVTLLLPAGAGAEVAGLAHEVIEAHLFRQIAAGGALSPQFARHVVDDLVIPVLTSHQKGKHDVAGLAGPARG